MLALFSRYLLVGAFNTLVHWVTFLAIHLIAGSSQATANLLGFFAAASCSFIMNARFTFKTRATGARYMLFMTFMGLLSFATGEMADWLELAPFITLLIFSAFSLACGFLYSRFVVFRSTGT